jgi:hypothetical protein
MTVAKAKFDMALLKSVRGAIQTHLRRLALGALDESGSSMSYIETASFIHGTPNGRDTLDKNVFRNMKADASHLSRRRLGRDIWHAVLRVTQGEEVMTEIEHAHRPLRSIGAVFAGLLFIFIVTTLIDVVLHATGVFPPWGKPMSDAMFGVATAYRIIISIAGCYIAARLAPRRPMLHALVLGVIGVVISAIGAAVTWNKGAVFGPHWYPLLLVIVAIPCAWVGGKAALD